MTSPIPQTTGFRSGLATALPIVLGYLPIAFSFGVAATRAGLGEWEAVFLSMVIYAGAAQFLALALIAGGAPLPVAAATLIVMNVRHVLYGPALLEKAGADASARHAWAWGFGLTDEVFGAALGSIARGGRRFSEPFMFGIGLAAYASWVAGTAAGALAGGAALEAWPTVDAGLGFMLPALFLALLMSILSRSQLPAVVLAGSATMAGVLLISSTAGILGGIMAGALGGALTARKAPAT